MPRARLRSEHLKPCPFCLGLDLTLHTTRARGEIHRVICQRWDCRADGPSARDPHEAIDKWNAREPVAVVGWVQLPKAGRLRGTKGRVYRLPAGGA